MYKDGIANDDTWTRGTTGFLWFHRGSRVFLFYTHVRKSHSLENIENIYRLMNDRMIDALIGYVTRSIRLSYSYLWTCCYYGCGVGVTSWFAYVTCLFLSARLRTWRIYRLVNNSTIICFWSYSSDFWFTVITTWSSDYNPRYGSICRRECRARYITRTHPGNPCVTVTKIRAW